MNATICDRCGTALRQDSDDTTSPRHISVMAKNWANPVGNLDLCPPCWETVEKDCRQYHIETASVRDKTQLALGEDVTG